MFCLEQRKVTDMTISDNASIDDITHGGGEIPPCTGLTPDALPEVPEPVNAENLQSGVSTRYAPLPKVLHISVKYNIQLNIKSHANVVFR